MGKWKNRWVCPHWEFLFFQEDAPDVPFSERASEGAATFVDILNVRGHNVDVRADFYDLQGNPDHRFGFEGVVGDREVWSYRTDTGPNFPKPAPGVTVTAKGWFEIRASEPVDIAVHVEAGKHDAFSRAWAYFVPIFEWPFPKVAKVTGAADAIGSGISANKPRPPSPRAAKKRPKRRL